MTKATWIQDDGRVRYLPQPYEIIDTPLWYHKRGLSQTASGYGSRLNSGRSVRLQDGRVRRIYITQYSNAGTAWITLDRKLWVVS